MYLYEQSLQIKVFCNHSTFNLSSPKIVRKMWASTANSFLPVGNFNIIKKLSKNYDKAIKFFKILCVKLVFLCYSTVFRAAYFYCICFLLRIMLRKWRSLQSCWPGSPNCPFPCRRTTLHSRSLSFSQHLQYCQYALGWYFFPL